MVPPSIQQSPAVSKNVKILALETSLRQGSVATLTASDDQATVIQQALLASDRRTAQSLLPTLQSLCAASGWKPLEIGLIAVTTGPGSFTGLRIGVTTAKSLAYAIGAHLVGVHTLATIAANFPTATGRGWTVLDAQREEFYASCFERPTVSQLVQEPETRILSIDEWLAQLQPGDTVSGPPLVKLVDRLPQGVILADPKYWQPSAEMVGHLGYEAFQQGLTTDPMQLVPNYYRKSAAEEKAAGR